MRYFKRKGEINVSVSKTKKNERNQEKKARNTGITKIRNNKQ